MTGNIKAIRTRIKSVESTCHITRAMQLVASSKMRVATMRMEKSKNFFRAVQEAFGEIAARGCDSVYMKERPVVKRCLIIIAGDRGLAGGYNANIFRAVRANKYDVKSVIAIPIGKRACDFCRTEGYECAAEYESVEAFGGEDAVKLADTVRTLFRDGGADTVELFYTEYVSALTQTARQEMILPIKPTGETARRGAAETVYEPDPVTVFDAVIPQYLTGYLVGAVGYSFASETAARRNAMDSATGNAEEMIETLSLAYNRARQGAITQEITEIVAGSTQA